MIPPFLIPRGLAEYGRLAIVLLLGLSLGFMRGCSHGRSVERHDWEAAAARLQAQITERARQADASRTTELTGTNAQITHDRQELDNATRNLPDETPSARRRARICAELRSQASRDHTAAPAC